jgi:hypothetical protein
VKGSRWNAFFAVVLVVLFGAVLVGSTTATPPQLPEEIVFRSDRAAGQPDLFMIGRDGSNFRRLTFTAARERTPRISPDGKWVAFASNAAGNFDIWVVRRSGGDPTQVTTDPEFEDNPRWLPDGRIAFERGPATCTSTCSVVVVKRDGSEEATIPIGGIQGGGFDISPDGTEVLFGRDGVLYVANLDGTGTATQITTPAAGASHFRPSIAPDGQRFAFMEDPNGVDNELVVANVDGTGVTQLTATPGRHEEYPGWSAAGDKILFMTFGSENRLRQIDPDGTDETLVSTDLKAPWADTFSRDGRDSSVWHEIVQGTGVTIDQGNGRVEVSFAADATQGGPFNNIEGHFGSQCSLPGDFDMQMDYEALAWPAANGTEASLAAFFANASVGRASQTSAEQYTTWLDGVGGWATTEENAGAVRLVRSEGRFRAFWRYQNVWVPLRSNSANTNAVVFGFSLRSFNNQFAHQPVKVAFDNFRLNSGAVECPEWWRSADFGDFG